jgi:signal transduction histidine kinase
MKDAILTGASSRRRSTTRPRLLWRWITSLGCSISIRSAGPLLLMIVCLLLAACHGPQNSTGSAARPAIEFTSVPTAGADNPDKLNTIKGRVIGGQPGQQIVLYAKGQNTWWVQPFAIQPFTKIQADSNWKNSTHPGVEYAALLVGPEFRPPLTADVLPTEGVIAFNITKGEPAFWQRWWFPIACVIAGALVVIAFYRFRLHQVTNQLKVRYEDRLAERARVAQELHDTLLQGVISASMQLHVAVDQLPADSPAGAGLQRVLQLMGQVVEEGRNTVRGLRPSIENARDLEYSFSRVPQELGIQQEIGFRVIVEGSALPLQSVVRDDVYRIGREGLVNAFRHSRASKIELKLEYSTRQLRILVRDDGCGIDPQVLQSGREGHWGLSGMRERAERIGARLKVWSRAVAGTEVELTVPSYIAFELPSSNRLRRWLAKLYPRKAGALSPEPGTDRDR